MVFPSLALVNTFLAGNWNPTLHNKPTNNYIWFNDSHILASENIYSLPGNSEGKCLKTHMSHDQRQISAYLAPMYTHIEHKAGTDGSLGSWHGDIIEFMVNPI